jgi:hypothetical protein
MTPTDQKVKEAFAELSQWVGSSEDELTTYGLEKIKKKLEVSPLPGSVINGFRSVNRWYGNLFVYEFLKSNTTTSKREAVASSYHIMIIHNEFSKLIPGKEYGPMFEEAGLYLANCLSEKWYAESKTLLTIINQGLGTGFLNGGLDFKPSVWFIIEMANKGYGITIDYKKYNYPQSMGVYQEALDNWDTKDLVLLDAVVSKLCDYHLENATYGDGENTADIQFDDSAVFVYAYEILTWLSIREMVGLKNPETFTHPLMALELNKLPKVASTMPQNELFDRVLAKIRERAQNGQ